MIILNFVMKNIVRVTEMYMQHGGACVKRMKMLSEYVHVQVKELVDMRDKYVDRVLNRGECSEIIECLCTE